MVLSENTSWFYLSCWFRFLNSCFMFYLISFFFFVFFSNVKHFGLLSVLQIQKWPDDSRGLKTLRKVLLMWLTSNFFWLIGIKFLMTQLLIHEIKVAPSKRDVTKTVVPSTDIRFLLCSVSPPSDASTGTGVIHWEKNEHTCAYTHV